MDRRRIKIVEAHEESLSLILQVFSPQKDLLRNVCLSKNKDVAFTVQEYSKWICREILTVNKWKYCGGVP
jgi:hypothetical protein